MDKALNLLIKRHEVLRTSFERINDEPVQIVHDYIEFNLTYQESFGASEEDLMARFIKPFNLNEASLLRVAIVKIAVDKYVLMFDMYHIISDGVSINILIRDIVRLYKGLTLPELVVQYKDYSVWQKALYKSEIIKMQEKYWSNMIDNNITSPNIPTDYPRPLIQNHQGEIMRLIRI